MKAISNGDLASQIDYQKNAVVSSEIIRKPTGTVTLFAFDKGQGLSEHSAPFDALVQILDGEMEITISKQPYIIQSGKFIIMPANDPHALKALTPVKMLLTMIKS
ncbi:MAG TPA: cupin domain-containing protein [Candidatus Marinimicrobia bacterium]|nr:cupin domain-containing protein [Candidatus Neomarinimicrobiota bacterium]